ncbi:hypothetical protein H5410_013511 [Solanum commersonii]|uniref:Uncharacterized protein n=1 Tax=Solanum commersonii TaxID=4109 RepID=A0A9J5ZNM1_SOLCO|nr:hypothetical protein H5410_013511 [Solanum commersonii]
MNKSFEFIRCHPRACGTIDIGYNNGQPFTWCNQFEEARIWKRADGAVVNDINGGVPPTTISHLPSIGVGSLPIVGNDYETRSSYKVFQIRLLCWMR